MAPRRRQKQELGPEWLAARFEQPLGAIGAGAGVFVLDGALMVIHQHWGMWTAGLEQHGRRFFELPTEHGTPVGAETALRAHLAALGDALWALALTGAFARPYWEWAQRCGWARRERAEFHARSERNALMGGEVRQHPDGSWVVVWTRGHMPGLWAVGRFGALIERERRQLEGAA